MQSDNGVRSIRFVRVVDGDTFFGLMDLVPPGVSPLPQLMTKIRVRDWNAAELSEPEGPILRQHFEQLLTRATRIDVALLRPGQTRARMTYDRIEAAVFLDGQLFAGLMTERLLQLRRSTG